MKKGRYHLLDTCPLLAVFHKGDVVLGLTLLFGAESLITDGPFNDSWQNPPIDVKLRENSDEV